MEKPILSTFLPAVIKTNERYLQTILERVVSDLLNSLEDSDTNVNYPWKRKDTPIPIYAQLMTVLPIHLKSLVPKPFVTLMEKMSMWPKEFSLDLIGHTRMWRAEPILPPIRMKRLLRATNRLIESNPEAKHYTTTSAFVLREPYHYPSPTADDIPFCVDETKNK
jgi:hypothetical protein